MNINQYNSKKIHTFKPFLSKIGEKMANYKNWYYLLSSLMIISQSILFFTIRIIFEKYKEQKEIIDLIFMFSFFLSRLILPCTRVCSSLKNLQF